MTRADLTLPTPVPLLFHAEGSITNSQDEVSLRKKNGKGGVKSTPGQVLINSFLINCILYDILTLRYHGTLRFLVIRVIIGLRGLRTAY